MGHKVSPVGFRVGINCDWNSRWFVDKKKFSKFLLEDIAIRNYINSNKDIKKAILSHIKIERRKKSDGSYETFIFIYVFSIGMIVNHDNKIINQIKKDLEKIIKSKFVIYAIAVKDPFLNAQIVAKMIANDLENRVSFRIAQKKAIANIRKAGASGCRTLVSGRLGGTDIARSEGYKEGMIPLHTLDSDIDFARSEAKTIYGNLGIKVWICRGKYKKKE